MSIKFHKSACLWLSFLDEDSLVMTVMIMVTLEYLFPAEYLPILFESCVSLGTSGSSAFSTTALFSGLGVLNSPRSGSGNTRQSSSAACDTSNSSALSTASHQVKFSSQFYCDIRLAFGKRSPASLQV